MKHSTLEVRRSTVKVTLGLRQIWMPDGGISLDLLGLSSSFTTAPPSPVLFVYIILLFRFLTPIFIDRDELIHSNGSAVWYVSQCY